ncbi:hypothetical protein [Streptosporangium vulgare]|uniref:hypothetical protein n=1 Tax=Streptosporangium vulgare TaxID=46190 RepID=UPI0031D6042B
MPRRLRRHGMLVVAALTADRVVEFREAGGLRRLAASACVLVAFSTPLLAAGMWIAKGVDGPLRGTVRDVVPAPRRGELRGRRADPAAARLAGRSALHRAARAHPGDRRGRHPCPRRSQGAGPGRRGRAGVRQGR